MYTTNAIEGLNMQARKVIKNRGHFPNDEAAKKTDLVSLAQHREKLENTSHHLARREKTIRHSVRRALHDAPVTKH